MTEPGFLTELLVVIAIALAGVALFEHLRLPAIAGFLVMGAALGPGGLGLTRDVERVRVLAEFGVVFLMFEIGLELPIDVLRRLWRTALLSGGLQVACTLGGVALLAMAAGTGGTSALVVGGLVAMSSTALVMRLLAERGELDAPHGVLSVGILLFQDICIVPMLVAIPILAGSVPFGVVPIALSLARAALALAVIALAAGFLLPWVLDRIAHLRSRDLFSLLAFLMVVGSAVAADAMGLTLAIGAFCAGLVMSASPYSHQLFAEVVPLRGVLLGIFFTAVGMLFDPAAALEAWPEVLAYVGGVMLLKAGVILVVVALVLRRGLRLGVLTALALAQTGEFSFVLAQQARSAGLLSDSLHQVFIAGSLLTLIATPFLMRGAPELAARLVGRADARPQTAAAPGETLLRDHVVVVGFGLTGRTLARVLRATGHRYLVLEANPNAVKAGRRQGEPVFFGDATRPAVLERVHARDARLVAVAISDPLATRRTVTVLRELAPRATIIARTRYVAEVDELYRLGASLVVAEEFEATLDMLSAVLRSVGVAAEAVGRLADEMRAEGYEALRMPPTLLLDPWYTELLQEIATEWVEVPDGPAAGRSIAELAVRKRTGASIVAVRRGQRTEVGPGPEFQLAAGDRMLVVAGPDSLARLRELLGSVE